MHKSTSVINYHITRIRITGEHLSTYEHLMYVYKRIKGIMYIHYFLPKWQE